MTDQRAEMPDAGNRRRHDDQVQCSSYLGEAGALMFYAYCALHHEVTLKQLQTWTGNLQSAIESIPEDFRPRREAELPGKALVTDLVVGKSQVSNWKRSSPMAGQPAANACDVRFASFRVNGIAAEEDGKVRWSGHLLLGYDVLTDSVIHLYSGFSRVNHQLTADPLLYGIQKVLAEIEAQRSKQQAQTPIQAIDFSGLGQEKFGYGGAIRRLKQSQADQIPVEFEWLGVSGQINLPKKVIIENNLRDRVPVSTYYPTSQKFRNVLVRIAKAFNKQAAGKASSRWISLNQLKADEKKVIERFNKS